LSDKFAPKLAVKRWQRYLKSEEGERGRRYSNKNQSLIAVILWLLKLITTILEKIGIKNKRIVEKISVE
jgi:hypothetical protein